MTEIAVPKRMFPLTRELLETIDQTQRHELERAGCHEISFDEWRWVENEAYVDEDGFHEAWACWQRAAFGVSNDD
jgi:hypothetical protein